MKDSAIVIGGGPTKHADFSRCPKGLIVIGCNYHWMDVALPHFMVFMDDPNDLNQDAAKLLRRAIKVCSLIGNSSKIVSCHKDYAGRFYSTNEIKKYCRSTNTGIIATWYASLIVSGEVYLCGFDRYKNDPATHEYINGRWYDFFEKNPHLKTRIIDMNSFLYEKL